MSYKLYLDDVRPIPEGWIGARSFEEFTDYIKKNGIPSEVSFDHDLKREEYHIIKDRPANRPLIEFPIDYKSYRVKTGYHCVKWLKAYCERGGKQFPPYNLHTDNSTGAKNMYNLIEKNIKAD